MGSRFVDSNLFIYVMMQDESFAEQSLGVLEGFERGAEVGWTSTLVLSQVFSHLKKRGKFSAIDKFYGYLESSPISVLETTRDDIVGAQEIKNGQSLPWSMWDDLVIAAQMKRAKIDEIYSNDGDFDKIKGLRRVF
ncbi:MAG: type II toxin-antitoxin system VapC family toxin [Nitrososphaerota archaeon]|nr:type II toxin-antitoxin system VapC family toxin [Nitrososphaerota archaeon]MDG7026290.1 type II toxin-antitoxin system VapC family toxin [Nitrososphaerota archaeon]